MSGYTAVLCGARSCRGPGSDAVAAALRECVGASRHGVLVVAGCSLGTIICAARGGGSMLVVQPCDEDRRPTRPMLRIGPLRSTADIDAVVGWLQAQRWDACLLPPRLVAPHRALAGAALN